MSNRTVKISHRCPKGHCRAWMHANADVEGRKEQRCPRCGEEVALRIPAEIVRDRLIANCACCPGREFFIRKDFPQALGFSLVVLFGLAASVCFYYRHVIATFAVLASLVVVDAIIFLLVGRVTVCYRCRAEYRGFAYNPDHEGFDLATSEKYG